MTDEPLTSYREGVRSRLQELMLTENYPPGHPLVSATARHLDMTTADNASKKFSAPSLEYFYRGCDLYYPVAVRPASPLSPHPPTSAPTQNISNPVLQFVNRSVSSPVHHNCPSLQPSDQAVQAQAQRVSADSYLQYTNGHQKHSDDQAQNSSAHLRYPYTDKNLSNGQTLNRFNQCFSSGGQPLHVTN